MLKDPVYTFSKEQLEYLKSDYKRQLEDIQEYSKQLQESLSALDKRIEQIEKESKKK